MPTIFETIFQYLKAQEILVAAETLKKYEHQGWMSTVYTVDSDQGKLIIHLVSLVEEHQINKVWDKFTGLASILSAHQEIPSPQILLSTMIEGEFVLVQKFVEGERAGKRKLLETIISDDWVMEKEEVLPETLHALASIHQVKLEGFGWPKLDGINLKGKYDCWKDFFKANISDWIGSIQQADARLQLDSDFPQTLEPVIQKIVSQIDYTGPSILIHGDAINPSNILVRNQQNIILLDWEWSIAGDPAWEFCDLGWWDVDIEQLQPYFQAMKMKDASVQKDFFQRIQTYIPLWLLWGSYMHAQDVQPDIYIALRKLLIERVCKEG